MCELNSWIPLSCSHYWKFFIVDTLKVYCSHRCRYATRSMWQNTCQRDRTCINSRYANRIIRNKCQETMQKACVLNTFNLLQSSLNLFIVFFVRYSICGKYSTLHSFPSSHQNLDSSHIRPWNPQKTIRTVSALGMAVMGCHGRSTSISHNMFARTFLVLNCRRLLPSKWDPSNLPQ